MSASRSADPSRTAIGFVAVTIILLGALVWGMRPAHPHLTPAPLQPPAPGCPRTSPTFVPTNITSLRDSALQALPSSVRNRVLLRANMEPCTCGCAMSIASCRASQPRCET
ncbi:MAG: hypothetical protein ACRD2O_16570, partial [Terriglobia bacterium]